jgi:hypothetical protein
MKDHAAYQDLLSPIAVQHSHESHLLWLSLLVMLLCMHWTCQFSLEIDHFCPGPDLLQNRKSSG